MPVTLSGATRRLVLVTVLVLAGTVLSPAPAQADWSRPTVLSRGADNGDPLVDVDRRGGAMAAWNRGSGAFEPEASRVLLRRRPATGGWSATRPVSPKGSVAYLEGLAVDGGGGAVVMWNDNRTLYARRVGRDLSLGRVKQISVTGEIGPNPGLAVDDAGNALFTWTARVGSSTGQPYARHWSARGGLGLELALAGDASIHAETDPHPALTGDGHGLVSWGDDSSAYARRFTPGQGWGPVVALGTTPDGSYLGFMRPFVDAAGNATVVWNTAGHADQEFLYAVRLPAGGPAGDPWRLSQDGDLSTWQGAMDAEGDLRVVWNSGLDVPAFTRHVPAVGEMHPVQRLARRSTYLRVTMREGGSGLLVWGRSGWDLEASARAVRFRADGSVADRAHVTPYAPSGGLAPLPRSRFLNVQVDPRNDSTATIQARTGP